MEEDRFIQPDTLDYHYTDAISDKACTQITEAVADGKPFFSYVAYTAPHWPLHAPRDLIRKYEETFLDGWDTLRNERHERLRDDNLLSRKWAIGQRDAKVRSWQSMNEETRRWEALRMAVYTAMIDQMDAGIGRILQTLDDLKVRDNTLVIFLSDNGGCAEFLREDGEEDRWPGFYRIPNIDGSLPTVGNIPGRSPGGPDTFMSYDLAWAHASNSPFRLYKSYVHEGGISTPLIIQPPSGKTPVRQRAVNHETVHLIDLIPTILDYSGAVYPQFWQERLTDSLPGTNLRPILEDKPINRGTPLYWEHLGNAAIREGDLKLVRENGKDWELYRMDRDRTETENLAGRYPADRKRLIERYTDWTQWVGVRPHDEVRQREKEQLTKVSSGS
jgi:arylsulfatase